MDWKGKVVLVTGASSGIGYETASLFLEKGARVYLNGRDEQKLAKAVEALINFPGTVVALPGDVSRVGQCEAMLSSVEMAGYGLD